MSNKKMGGSSVDANVLGVRFFDGTYQTTAAVGPAAVLTSIQNGNTGSFYLPLLPNPTAPVPFLILDAPQGALTIQADAGAGVGVGGQLTLLSSNGPAPINGFSLFSGLDIIQGGGLGPGIEISASSGPLVLRNGSSQDVQITHGSGTNGVKLDWADNTLKPIGTGHLLADMIQQGTPSSSSSTGKQGQVLWDINYIYVCTATNTWMRAALSTW